jgi:hypothetical protein
MFPQIMDGFDAQSHSHAYSEFVTLTYIMPTVGLS